MEPSLIQFVTVVVVAVAVFLIFREFFLWYFRINQRFDKLEQIEKNQQETNRLLAQIAAQNQAAIQTNELQRRN